MLRYLRLLYLAVLIVSAVTLETSVAKASETEKVVDTLAISSALQENGSARVIVTFSLNSYDTLRAAAITSINKAAAADAASVSLLQADAQQAQTALSTAIATGVADAMSGISNGTAITQHVFSSIPTAVVKVDTDGLHALETMDSVVHIEFDKQIALPEPIAGSGEVDAPASDYGDALIGADQAWAEGFDGNGWYVAILDTGIRTTHEFFTGKNIVEACFNSATEDNPDSTLCPNGEDSMYGAGAAAFTGSTSIDGYDHGNHVAGIAAGHKPDNTLNGVAKSADIIAINVFSNGYTNAGGGPEISASFSDIMRALEYVYTLAGSYKIAAANMSLGGGEFGIACDAFFSSVKTLIDNLRDLKIASVIASGNGYYCSSISSPACISTSVAVGASDKDDVKASFSNWKADMVPLFAPGVDITSATAASDTSYESWNGTSMATPFVTGAWAVIRQKAPNATVTEILEALKSTAAHVTFETCDNPTDIDRRIALFAALNEFSVAADQADILFHNAMTGRNAVWYLSGSSYYGFDMLETTPTPWYVSATGDFNSDGETDILWHNDAGKTALWHMNGVELQDWAMLETTPAAWFPVGAGDCNQDGQVDIYWQNQYNGKVAVWYMDDTTRTDIAYGEETLSPPWSIKGVADFTADGLPDLLWRNSETGVNRIWTMDGLSMTSSTDIQSAGTDWLIVGTGDFNGDDSPDILWRRSNTNANYIWYMDGTDYSSMEPTDKATGYWEAQGAGVFH